MKQKRIFQLGSMAESTTIFFGIMNHLLLLVFYIYLHLNINADFFFVILVLNYMFYE